MADRELPVEERQSAADPLRLEGQQPDPMLQMSRGRLNTIGLSLVTLAIAVVVGVVLYGLNSGRERTANAPSSAPASTAATNGGGSGGDAAPAQPAAASPSKG